MNAEQLWELLPDAAQRRTSVENVADVLNALAKQPAAAPIDTPTDREFALSAAICVHPKGVYGDEGGSMCCPITHTRDASFAPSPAAWAVYNGWSRICFYKTEEDARDHAQKAQKNHDLSGSLAAFRVVPLYAAPRSPAVAAQPDKVKA